MGRTILLADEDQQLVLMLRSMLEGRGYSVVHTATGRETLESARNSVPDMVIVGEQIGDIDGIGLILKLRKANGGLKICFVSNQWRESELYQQLTKECRVALIVHRPLKPSLFAAQIDSQFADTGMRMASGSEAEEKTFLALRARFTEVLPMRLATIEDAIDVAMHNRSDSTFAVEARRLAHNLKGTASSCGFDLVGEAAAHLERALAEAHANGAALKDTTWDEIEALFTSVQVQAATELKRNAPTTAQIEQLVDDSNMAKVLLVAPENLVTDESALKNGLPIKVIHGVSAADALDKACRTTFDAVVIDMEQSPQESLKLARELRGMAGYESLPLAFITNGSQPADKTASMHAGASIFLEKPLEQQALRNAIEYLLQVRQGGRPRVLVVDDDDDFSNIISVALGKEGILVQSLSDPAKILASMEAFSPDLVLLDVMMPGVSGFDVCRKLRGTPRWQDMPILFLTAQTELDARLAAFDAGGDDYLPKPVAPVELLTRVKVRLERARLLKERADRDILTGLYLRRAFMEQLNALISEADRYNLNFTVALLDIDHFKKVNDTYGHLAGDRVLSYFGQLLKRRFRVEDLRGRWGGEEFIVALRHEGKPTTMGALGRVKDELFSNDFKGDHGEEFRVSFTAGLATFPVDGKTIESLVHAADSRLYKGKERGRNTIISE